MLPSPAQALHDPCLPTFVPDPCLQLSRCLHVLELCELLSKCYCRSHVPAEVPQSLSWQQTIRQAVREELGLHHLLAGQLL
jgi:hypothetical protein